MPHHNNQQNTIINNTESNTTMTLELPVPPIDCTVSSDQMNSYKRLKRARSVEDAVVAAIGESEQKRTKKDKAKVEYHDKRKHAPIFIQKTYEMINTCDPSIASWTDDGSMFSIKDQKLFAERVIPQFFDHSNFSSFSRQLNFYMFRKIQARAIYKDDYKESAKYVTFFNKHFHREKPELLKEIKRTTNRTQNAASQHEQQKEIEMLREKVELLETLQKSQNDRIAALEALILKGSPKRDSDALDENATIKIDIDSIPLMLNQQSKNRQESAFTLRGISASSIGDLVKMSAFDKKFLQSALFDDGSVRQSSTGSLRNIDLDSVVPL
mmetsp:Transcript_2256/g.2727  ORF Transcript_2256/g.2727 Transcript_2256/m.2727 type:complete len:326 (+) Transcript_2256:12-989(+)